MAAALPVLVVGAVALLYLFATAPLWRPALVNVLGQAPVVGGWLAGRLDALILGLASAAAPWAEAAVAPWVDALDALRSAIFGHAQAVSGALGAATSALWALRYQLLPALEARTQEYANARAQEAEGYARQLYDAAVARADQEYRQAVARADQDMASAETYARALAVAAEAFATQLYQAAVSYVEARAAEDAAYAQELAQGAEQYAAAGIAAAEGYAAQLLDQAVQYARALSLEDRALIEGVRVQDQDYARALAGQVASFAQALTVPLALAIEAIENSPCMQRCGTLGNLGGELEALDIGFILAILATVIQDPQGAARAVAEGPAQEIRAAGQTIAGLLGVQ